MYVCSHIYAYPLSCKFIANFILYQVVTYVLLDLPNPLELKSNFIGHFIDTPITALQIARSSIILVTL